jgi:hypothetical protein
MVTVIPDVRVAIFVVGTILGVGPLPDTLLRCRTVPLTVSVRERKVLEC